MEVCRSALLDPKPGLYKQIPVAHLVCNSTPPIDGISLMTFREVETLFHEFGHGLQHMLTKVPYLDASGINGIEWDAVELPSQFMENWCYHKKTLLSLSGHIVTNDPLPEILFEKIKNARTYRSASRMLRQLTFAFLDLEVHTTYNPYVTSPTIFSIHKKILEETELLPMLPNDFTLCSFSHIFAGGYECGYYSYKWAEVLSADAFAAFLEAGQENYEEISKIGRRFRRTILEKGGSRHPIEIFYEFRGAKPDPNSLLKQENLI